MIRRGGGGGGGGVAKLLLGAKLHPGSNIVHEHGFIYLFELMLYAPITNNGNVGTLPPF